MLITTFNNNIEQLIEGVEDKTIAVAVSGGSDSVALLMLMHLWAREHNYQIVVMTVNHNLREPAKEECEYVNSLSKRLGHECHLLSWDHQNNFANLQARAREGRYKLMTDLCDKLNISTLITAHHRDDYIENFWIRCKRKSGVFGLSSSNINFSGNLKIIRPLFNIPKAELVDYLTKNNIKWYEDESNNSPKYLRGRIRLSIMPPLNEGHVEEKRHCEKLSISDEAIGLNYLNELPHSLPLIRNDTDSPFIRGESKIPATMQQINQQAVALQGELIAAIAESVAINEFGFATIDLAIYKRFSADIQLHLINYVLTIIGGHNKIPRSRSSSPLVHSVGNKADFTKTLHGCCIKMLNEKLLIYREFGKKTPPDIFLSKDALWDNRFCFKGKVVQPEAYITRLTLSDYISIKDQIDLKSLKNMVGSDHKKILFTLPVVKILEKVVALPHISYYNARVGIDHTSSDNCGVDFVPGSSCTLSTLRSSAPKSPSTYLPEAGVSNNSEEIFVGQFVFSPIFVSRFIHFC